MYASDPVPGHARGEVWGGGGSHDIINDYIDHEVPCHKSEQQIRAQGGMSDIPRRWSSLERAFKLSEVPNLSLSCVASAIQ